MTRGRLIEHLRTEHDPFLLSGQTEYHYEDVVIWSLEALEQCHGYDHSFAGKRLNHDHEES